MKARYPGALLLFRMGDFYETFDDDARMLARDAGIVLTQRDMGQGEVVPLAGVPYHALDTYLARLIRKGHRVAICEQTSQPDGRTLVDRDVVRVVTPGTVIEPGLLEQGANNYLVAVATGADRAGVAYVDVTTGDFGTTEVGVDAAAQEVARLAPAELLVASSSPGYAAGRAESGDARWLPSADDAAPYTVTQRPAVVFAERTARRRLLDHFGVTSLEAYGCEGLPLAAAAAGALVDYLGETHQASLTLLTSLHTYSTESFMALDPQTRRNLELYEGGRWGAREHSLLRVLDLTKTPMGARLLRSWIGQPLLDLDELTRRQDAVTWLHATGARRQRIQDLLAEVSDIERTLHRVGAGVAVPREVVGLRRSLEQAPALKSRLAEEDGRDAGLAWLDDGIDPCADVVAMVAQAIADDPQGDMGHGRVMREGFSKELDELRSASQDARTYIAGLERRERERTGISNLKVGYNKVFGYYLEVTTPHLARVPDDYVRRQTLVNAERFFTPELKEYESRVLNAGDRMVELESALYRQVCRQIADAGPMIAATARSLATLDALASLAEAASRYGYVRPTLGSPSMNPERAGELSIKGGRHPVVERVLPTGAFVPNDTHLAYAEDQVVVLTGPNMAGKSTYLRQVALIVLMAQIGSFVPADEAHVGLVDRIFTRVGLQDDLAAGQSTFMVEMLETAAILHHATRRSLVILDEIGRGTSTYDGLSIAQAVAEHLHNEPRLGCRTLFATHYHELTELARRLPRVSNYSVAVAEEDGEVVFLHRIVPGGADRSYGVHVAQLAGLPPPVVHRAWELLAAHEQDGSARPRAAPDAVAPRTGPGLRRGARGGAPAETQLAFFGADPAPSPALEALRALDLNGLTPLEALNKLYELQQQAGAGPS